MYTIGQVAKRFSLSRSTLLYYDSIGLLTPSGRSSANYRIYSDADILRMEKIALFREAGLPLESIATVLKLKNNEVSSVLETQLHRINKDISSLRHQQGVIIQILKSESAHMRSRMITKEHWVSLLKATGLDEDDMTRWHNEFERMSPEAHQDFLESLGIDEEEIKLIRDSSSDGNKRR